MFMVLLAPAAAAAALLLLLCVQPVVKVSAVEVEAKLKTRKVGGGGRD